jgi:bifunctional DNA-binding transcriptional regulator/antitoxin component of YhaV-PrlF toxin-antitoxin module
MSVVKLLRGDRITLPAEIRKALEFDEGDHLEADRPAQFLDLISRNTPSVAT